MLMLTTKKRKCGRKQAGGFYIVGGEPMQDEEGSSPVFTLVVPPVPYDVGVHRGWRLVNGDAILQRLPLAEWWEGSSKETELQKDGDLFWESFFGMPLNQRMNSGILVGITKPEEGLKKIVETIKYNHDLVKWYRQLTIDEVQNLPGAAVYCDNIRSNLSAFVKEQKADFLVRTQANIWLLAKVIPVKSRKVVLPTLIRMLMLLDLTEDVRLMQKSFPLGV